MYLREPVDYFYDKTEYNEPLKIHVVPMSFYTTFSRRHSLQDLHNYGKVREMASLNDIVEMEILRRRVLGPRPNEGMNFLSGNLVTADSLFENVGSSYSLTEEQVAELLHIRDFELHKPSRYFEALNPYWYKEDESDLGCDVSTVGTEPVEKEKPYQILKGPSRLYILMGEGCLAQIESGAARQAFLSDVLKGFYAIAPLEIVNQSAWYRLYIEGLAKQC